MKNFKDEISRIEAAHRRRVLELDALGELTTARLRALSRETDAKVAAVLESMKNEEVTS